MAPFVGTLGKCARLTVYLRYSQFGLVEIEVSPRHKPVNSYLAIAPVVFLVGFAHLAVLRGHVFSSFIDPAVLLLRYATFLRWFRYFYASTWWVSRDFARAPNSSAVFQISLVRMSKFRAMGFRAYLSVLDLMVKFDGWACKTFWTLTVHPWNFDRGVL